MTVRNGSMCSFDLISYYNTYTVKLCKNEHTFIANGKG